MFNSRIFTIKEKPFCLLDFIFFTIKLTLIFLVKIYQFSDFFIIKIIPSNFIFLNSNLKTEKKEAIFLKMSCFSSQEFSKISITPPPHKSISLPICHEEDDEKIISLPRGGCIIKTLIGNIQFGMPPETVKDALNMQLDVPLHYIIPTARFNRKYGLNVAEFEFPAYFNFFIRNKKINLICTKEAKDAIQIIFQETLLGPQNYDVHFYSYNFNLPKILS